MADPDPVLAALLAAIEANDHPDLRVAAARHLASIGRHPDALANAQAALLARPADVEALQLAATAAEHCGESDTATGYRTLLAAIGGAVANPPVTDDAPAPPAPNPTPAPAPAPALDSPPVHPPDEAELDAVLADGPDEDDYDTFLREVLDEDRANRVRLSDVGGLSQVKAELERRFFLPIRNPEIQKAYGKPINGGLLLYGPPGCGKTFLARAIAGELGANFLPVTLHDTLDMWMGQSERNLNAIFRMARSDTPTVLFFDEIDALGQRRSRSANSTMRGVVAQLLSELDGAVDRNDGVFVVGATNAPWDVDPALRRPGRFDRTVLVLPPDEEARVSILEYHLRDRPTADLDLRKVASKSAGLTGADLMLISETAVELAMERAAKSGRIEPVDQKLLDRAAKSVKPSVGPWLETARNYVTFANEDGEYDELERYLRSRKR